MRVHVVDPSAFTPPYDDELCRSLAVADAEVELYTSRFRAEVAPAAGYARHEFFYRGSRLVGDAPARRLVKLAEHVPDMLRYRRAARAADVVHFQWLTVPQVDGRLLPRDRPLVLTAHDIRSREPRPGQRTAERSVFRHFDAVVVHSQRGRERLVDELGVDEARVHVILHGSFVHLSVRRNPTHDKRCYVKSSLARPATVPHVPPVVPGRHGAGGNVETELGANCGLFAGGGLVGPRRGV